MNKQRKKCSNLEVMDKKQVVSFADKINKHEQLWLLAQIETNCCYSFNFFST